MIETVQDLIDALQELNNPNLRIESVEIKRTSSFHLPQRVRRQLITVNQVSADYAFIEIEGFNTAIPQ